MIPLARRRAAHRALDRLLDRRAIIDEAAFKEGEHPRDDAGKFSSGAGGAARGHADEGDDYGRPKTTRQKASYIEKDLGVDAAQARRFAEASTVYSGTRYRDVRAGKDKKTARALEEYIDRAPKWDGSGAVHRGITLPKEQAAALQVGGDIDMNGLSSWSSKKEVAEDYAVRARELKRKYGSPLDDWKREPVLLSMPRADHGTSIRHLSRFKGEGEVLMSGKVTYRITGIKKQKRKRADGWYTVTRVEVEEVAG